MDILLIYKEIYKILSPFGLIYQDEIPTNNKDTLTPNFSNGELGVFYVIDNIEDIRYRKNLNLEVTIVGDKNYKIQAQQKALIIDKAIDRVVKLDFRIKKSNAWLQTIDDEDKTNVVMQYYILNYE